MRTRAQWPPDRGMTPCESGLSCRDETAGANNDLSDVGERSELFACPCELGRVQQRFTLCWALFGSPSTSVRFAHHDQLSSASEASIRRVSLQMKIIRIRFDCSCLLNCSDDVCVLIAQQMTNCVRTLYQSLRAYSGDRLVATR